LRSTERCQRKDGWRLALRCLSIWMSGFPLRQTMQILLHGVPHSSLSRLTFRCHLDHSANVIRCHFISVLLSSLISFLFRGSGALFRFVPNAISSAVGLFPCLTE
jgi:hypothetical protein